MEDGPFVSPFLFPGTGTPDLFTAWLAPSRCPLLNAPPVVFIDTATVHKSERTRELIEGKGAPRLFLPTYSPELRIIEPDCAHSKTIRDSSENQTLDPSVQYYDYLVMLL